MMEASFEDDIEVELTIHGSTVTFFVEVSFTEFKPSITSDGVRIGSERRIDDVRVFTYRGIHVPGTYTPRDYEKTPIWLQYMLLENINPDKLHADWSDVFK